VEGAQRAATAQHKRGAAERVPRLAQEVYLLVQRQVRALVAREHVQVLLDLVDELADRLRHHRKVLVQLTAPRRANTPRPDARAAARGAAPQAPRAPR